MAVKKKSKKKPKKAEKGRKRVTIPKPINDDSGGCQTRGPHCEIRPGLFRSAPKKKK